MYSVYQHWDPLQVCVVGRSWGPEFYSWITVPHVRSLFERIAIETEQDYQKIIAKLTEFNVEVIRPELPDSTLVRNKFPLSPMCPRDNSIMIGTQYYHSQGTNYQHIHQHITEQNNQLFTGRTVVDRMINGAMTTRVGKDLYFANINHEFDSQQLLSLLQPKFPNYRCHVVNTQGHSDSTFCAVAPGLIISLHDIDNYAETFPDWQVVYLPNQSWDKVQPFLDLKAKNQGRWWIPGFEHDQAVIDLVETWLGHWTGYVEETVFDVNMLVIDPKNVIVFNYNKQVFAALEQHGITPHVIPFRHRYFWDGGVHCITSDLHRSGTMQDYFPQRS